MKKLILVLALGLVFGLGMMGSAKAEVETWVSFIYPFQGVDDTSAWTSIGENPVAGNNLGFSSFAILGSSGNVTGYYGAGAGLLSQRGTRGIGIQGRENDEIDGGFAFSSNSDP